MIIGEYGTGKTTFASTFPEPIYFFDMDEGLLGLINDKKEMDYDTYTDTNIKSPRAATQLENKLAELLKECKYKTVVFDTVTNLIDICFNKILQMNGRAGQSPQLQDYFVLMNAIKDIIYKAKALPCHALFIAHEHIYQDDTTGTIRSVPLAPSKLGSRLGGMFNEVYYTDVISKGKESEYRILTGIKGIKKGKTQLGRGKFDLYETPDFTQLMSKLNNEEVN